MRLAGRRIGSDRATILNKAASIVLGRREESATLITAESGLCHKDAVDEAGRVSDVADMLYEAGLPPVMLSVITGDPCEIADEMLFNLIPLW
jgi:acyl-CoA reductase-like NAD-dependent aldehyde dehydrogenase